MALLNLIIAALCVAVLIQFASCSSDHVTHVQNVNYGVHQAKLTLLPLLPRKLKLEEEASSSVKSLGENSHMPLEKLMEASSGKKENAKREENVVNKKAAGGKGASEYLTVDYNWVRRRRPIHNKQIPFLP